MRWRDWAGVLVAVAAGAVEAAVALVGRRVMDRPLSDGRPAPARGERVAYAPDPALFGVMLHLGDDPSYGKPWVLCELDPPASIPDGYEPVVETFNAGELVHADTIWKARPITQAGLPVGGAA